MNVLKSQSKMAASRTLTHILISVALAAFSTALLANNNHLLSLSYIEQPEKILPTLSNLGRLAKDSGLQGAHLGLNDSNTTGKFTGQKITLTSFSVSDSKALIETLEQQFQRGVSIFLLNLPMASLRSAQDWGSDKAVIFYNVKSPQDALRQQYCDANTFHTVASHSMKNDALAQWLLSKRLSQVLVIFGRHAQDIAIAKSFQRAAKRYGLTILAQKKWLFQADLRRSAAREMPLFTQIAAEYDVVFVSDHIKDFAEYLPYNTYLPRPVVGSAGLEPLAWHHRIEQWGAIQLQNRFSAQANRPMNEIDYAAYLAVRSVAQAFVKKTSTDNKVLKDYLRSGDFSLAAYVGRKLSYRPWNQQLRMPIALLQPNALISQSPQVGILHPSNDLDTLGFDQGESRCNFQRERYE